MPPVEILRAIVPTLRKAMLDFAFVQDVSETELSRWKAASMRASYTLGTVSGSSFPVLSRMWVVPRGKSLIIIGMSGPPDGPDVSEKEFADVLASIQIQP